MIPSRFVGRTDELTRLDAAARGVTGRGLFFSGSAGIGKSRLLREGLALLPTDRYAVWSASANVASAGLPYGGLVQVLPAEQPRGLSPAGLLRWAVDALHQQAAGRPIVLAVDDAHLLDPSSAALVYLIARSDNATVLGTMRNGEQLPTSIRAMRHDDLVDQIELKPLDRETTAGLLDAILEGPVEPATVDRIYHLSAGNPLLTRELVLAARNSGDLAESYGEWRWTGRLELAPSLTDLIDTRIGELNPGVRLVLELVAFGEPIGIELLKRATDEIDVETAEERELIAVVQDDRRSNVRLAHPLYGEMVRRRCPVSRTRRLKAQLADLLEGVGKRRRDDLLQVAVWRLDSGTAQDPALLLNAGGQAFGRYDVPLATRLARAALDAGGGFDAAELLATILMFGDQPDEAIEVLGRIADQVTTGARRSRWLTVRGMVGYWGLSRESMVDEVATGAADLSDPTDRARVVAFEAIMRLHRLEIDTAVRLSREVLDRPASSLAARELARCVIAHVQAARGELHRSGRAISAVEADANQWRTDMPYLQLALELARGTRLILAGDLAGIDAIVAAEFADLAQAGDFRLGSGYLSILRAYTARMRGQTSEALRASLGACAVLATSRVFAGLAQAERAQAAAQRGDVAQAAAAMADSDRAQAASMAILYPWREQARAATLAAGGDLTGATEHLAGLVRRLQRDDFAGHEMLALYDLVRYGRADLVIGTGATGADQTVAERLTELTTHVDGPLADLMARHARATLDPRGGDLMAIANEFAGLQLYVYAAEAAAGAVDGFQQRRPAAGALAKRRLADLLARCDQVCTPALLARQSALTEREREIAELAADGEASRIIASKLFLSPRTVENHLQRVYGKLGVTGRPELRAALRAMADRDGEAEG